MATDNFTRFAAINRLNINEFAIVRDDDAVLLRAKITTLELGINLRIFALGARFAFGLYFLYAPSLAAVDFTFCHSLDRAGGVHQQN
jgi:hypothetical protein